MQTNSGMMNLRTLTLGINIPKVIDALQEKIIDFHSAQLEIFKKANTAQNERDLHKPHK